MSPERFVLEKRAASWQRRGSVCFASKKDMRNDLQVSCGNGDPSCIQNAIWGFGVWGKREKAVYVPQGPRLGGNPRLRTIPRPVGALHARGSQAMRLEQLSECGWKTFPSTESEQEQAQEWAASVTDGRLDKSWHQNTTD